MFEVKLIFGYELFVLLKMIRAAFVNLDSSVSCSRNGPLQFYNHFKSLHAVNSFPNVRVDYNVCIHVIEYLKTFAIKLHDIQ